MSNLVTSSHSFNLSIESTLRNRLATNKDATARLDGGGLLDTFSNGVNELQLDRAWESGTIALAAGAELDFSLRNLSGQDINAGSGNDGLGIPVTMEEIVCLVIHVTGGAGKLEINPTLPADPVTWIPERFALDAFNGAMKLRGVRMWSQSDTQGYDTSPGSENVKFKALESQMEFEITIFGRSDDDESSSSSVSTSSSSVSSGSSSSSSISSASSTSESSQSNSSSS